MSTTNELLYYIPAGQYGKEGVLALLEQHPEIKFVSLVGIDLAGNDTDEKIPMSAFFDDYESFFEGRAVQTDGSSVVLTNIATLNNARVDMWGDPSVNWFVDYNYENIDPVTGLPTGTLRIPAFLMHNYRYVDSRSILKRSCDYVRAELLALIKEHGLPGMPHVKADEVVDIIFTSATELEFWVKTPSRTVTKKELSVSQKLQEQYWQRTHGTVRTALEQAVERLDRYGMVAEMGHKEVGGVKAKLDEDGHEAFTAMRLRGAKSTDIAVLVVAADDGVMPQTIEAINHAKSADVPIIVAINKMDKPGANPDHVKQQLSEHGLLPEEWGGDVIMVPVSAKQKQGIDDLLENILLVAEVMELKANPNRKAYGVVIEAQLDKGRGAVCTVLVQKGSLRVGDTVLAGTAYGKVRAMTNERGEKVKVARPSMPVEILGFSEVPQAGEIINGMDDNEARAIAEKRIAKQRVQELQATHKVTLDDIFNQIQQGELKDLNIIIKADVQGSVEALRQSLEGIKNPEVRIVIVHAAVGAINESDIMLASASNAIVMGFNVRPDANVRRAAEQEKVDLRTYRVIYDAINDVESAMRGMLAPQFKEVVVGRAEVRQVISTPKAIVAGSYVTEGRITNDSEVRLIRDGIVVFEGKVDSLRRFKDEVKEVKTSFECGISLEGYRDIKEGDVIEAYLMEEIAPQL